MDTILISTIPVLPSSNIERDTTWYNEKTGFETLFSNSMYAVLERENLSIHLQWHADTADDPLPGGSVVRIEVNNIEPLFEEFIERGTVSREKFHSRTDWGTREFGFYDLNNNAIFIFEDLK